MAFLISCLMALLFLWGGSSAHAQQAPTCDQKLLACFTGAVTDYQASFQSKMQREAQEAAACEARVTAVMKELAETKKALADLKASTPSANPPPAKSEN